MLNIDRLSHLTLKEFFENYLNQNKPCIFDKSFTSSWLCREDWINNGVINQNKLFKFNNINDEMSVADCNTNYFDSHLKSNMKLSEFLYYWDNQRSESKILYLKDWHYFLNNKDAEKCFKLLDYFKCDWLNEFCVIRNDVKDDYRFVYVGVEGSWTGLHVDVCLSYSWSANIIGEKRWWLFPPGNESLLNAQAGDVRCDINLRQTPHIEVIQKEGEIIFVPSGWYHQVVNLSQCVSINHNWLNGCSIINSWMYLCDKIVEVNEATEDVKDTPGYIEECQVCMKAYCGINFQEFITMIEFILHKRVYKLINGALSEKYYTLFEDKTDDTLKLQRYIEILLLSLSKDFEDSILTNNLEDVNEIEMNDILRAFEVLEVIIHHRLCIKLKLMNKHITKYVSEKIDFLKLHRKMK